MQVHDNQTTINNQRIFYTIVHTKTSTLSQQQNMYSTDVKSTILWYHQIVIKEFLPTMITKATRTLQMV